MLVFHSRMWYENMRYVADAVSSVVGVRPFKAIFSDGFFIFENLGFHIVFDRFIHCLIQLCHYINISIENH